MADPITAPFFKDIDMKKQRAKQVSFLTFALGGPNDVRLLLCMRAVCVLFMSACPCGCCVRWTLIYTLEQTCLTTNNQTQTQTQTTKKQYKGRSMYEAHKGMKLTDKEFNAVATHLVTTLRELGVKEDGAVAVLHALALPLSFLCLCVDL